MSSDLRGRRCGHEALLCPSQSPLAKARNSVSVTFPRKQRNKYFPRLLDGLNWILNVKVLCKLVCKYMQCIVIL